MIWATRYIVFGLELWRKKWNVTAFRPMTCYIYTEPSKSFMSRNYNGKTINGNPAGFMARLYRWSETRYNIRQILKGRKKGNVMG
jgi:hypothetical protein